MLTIRTIRMAYQPALKSMYLIKPVSVKPCEQSFQAMFYINQPFASDSKKPPKKTTDSVKDKAPQEADRTASCPNSSPKEADSSSCSSPSDVSPSSEECEPSLNSGSVSSSSSTPSAPSPPASPTEPKSSADCVKPIEINLPTREQVKRCFFCATVIVWDTSAYLYCIAVKIFDQYVLKQPVVQQNWAIFQKKMDRARQEMKSK